MRHVLIIAELTFREARRRKFLWTAIGLGIAFIALFSVGFFFIHRDLTKYGGGGDIALNSGFSFIVLAGMYVVSFLGVVLAVLTSVGSLSGEISSHTIQCLAIKPLKRGTIVLGKWLGLMIMLTSYIVLLAVGIMASTWIIAGYVPPNAVKGVLFIAFQAVIMLTVCVFGGANLSTIANGVVAFMLYGLAFIGGWVETIGAMTHNEAAVDIGILSSLLLPSEAMWKMAAYNMQPSAIRGLPVSPFYMPSQPSVEMLIYAIVYTIVLLGLAVRSFSRRDL